MSANCRDQSFGLIPKDVQLSNAKVNDILSTCVLSASNQTPIISSAYLGSEVQIYNPVLPFTVNLPFTFLTNANPTTFVSDADGFTIPLDGMYRISTNILVTEFAGINTIITILLNVNNTAPGPDSKFDLMGNSSIEPNQSGWISGEICLELNAGDTIQIQALQPFGGSTDVRAIPGLSSAQGSFYASRICIMKL